MSQPPLVSIIIPAHKAAPYLSETLDSILRQTWRSWEVLVLEDGIYDNTSEIIYTFSSKTSNRVSHYSNGCCMGVSYARNSLLGYASGSIVAFLDSDDIWDAQHLEHSISIMHEEQTDWVIAGYRLINSSGAIISNDQLPPVVKLNDLPLSLLRHNFIIPSGLVIKSEAFSKGLRFDESLSIGEDLDLCIRLVEHGFIPSYSACVTLNYRKHPASATANPIVFSQRFSFLYYKYLRHPLINSAECRTLLHMHLYAVAKMTWKNQPRVAMRTLSQLALVSPLEPRVYVYLCLAFLKSLVPHKLFNSISSIN